MLSTQSVRLNAYVFRLGWLTVAGWQADLASSAYVGGTLIQGFIELVNPAYKSRLWHASLLLYGAVALAIFTTTVIGPALPKIESLMFVVYISGYCGVMIPLIYLGPHGSARDVFTTFLNEGGWSSQTLSFFVGISGNAFAFLGARALHQYDSHKLLTRGDRVRCSVPCTQSYLGCQLKEITDSFLDERRGS